jgi:hypothetical protein
VTNLEILFEKRDAIRALFRRFRVAKYEVWAGNGLIGFKVEFPGHDTIAHFDCLDRLGRALKKLGLGFRQYASGYEFPYLRHKYSAAMSAELVFAIVTRFKNYFSFWQVVEGKERFDRRIVRGAEERRLAKRLKYRSIERDGLEVIVDGLVSRNGECTLDNAVKDLYPKGSDRDLRDLFDIIRHADRGPGHGDPKLVRKLDAAVRALARRRWIISAVPARAIPRGAHLTSHFHGSPYFLPGEAWPVNADTGRPLDFILQLVEPAALPKGVAVLQLFYDFDANPWRTAEAGWLVKTHDRLDRRRATTLPRPAVLRARRFSRIEITKDGSLPSWSDLRHEGAGGRAGKAIVDLCRKIDAYAAEDVYDRATKKLVKHEEAWSFAGGFPRGLQGKPGAKGSELLVQVGSDGKLDLMWGDVGVVYAFADRTGKRFGFELQCY